MRFSSWLSDTASVELRAERVYTVMAEFGVIVYTPLTLNIVHIRAVVLACPAAERTLNNDL